MEYYLTFTNRHIGRGKNRGENRLHDRRTKSRKDAVPASESDESSARAGDSEKAEEAFKVSAAGGSGSGTVLHLWMKRSSRRDTTWNRKNLILGFDFGEIFPVLLL